MRQTLLTLVLGITAAGCMQSGTFGTGGAGPTKHAENVRMLAVKPDPFADLVGPGSLIYHFEIRNAEHTLNFRLILIQDAKTEEMSNLTLSPLSKEQGNQPEDIKIAITPVGDESIFHADKVRIALNMSQGTGRGSSLGVMPNPFKGLTSTTSLAPKDPEVLLVDENKPINLFVATSGSVTGATWDKKGHLLSNGNGSPSPVILQLEVDAK